jgi:phosphoserine phosphatase RsbU/P
MHHTLQSLLHKWIAVIFACALSMVMGVSWYAIRTADDLISPELRQTTRVIGRSISAELERAIAYQIPLHELNGVEPWFADIVATNPVLLGLALTDETGVLVNGHRIPAGLHDALAQRRTLRNDAVDGWHISTLPVHGGVDKQVVGWMHVIGEMPNAGTRPLIVAMIAVAAITALSALLLRQLIYRHLVEPVQRSRDALIGLAAGQVRSLALSARSNSATALQAALSVRLQHLFDQSQQVLLKIGEVRAAHFDPQILQQLDELAAPLVERHRVVHLKAQMDAAQLERGMPVARKMVLTAVCAMFAVAVGLYTLMQVKQWGAQRALIHASELALVQAWQATLDQDRTRLDSVLLESLGKAAVLLQVERQDYERLSETLSTAASAPLTLALSKLDGTVLAASTAQASTVRPDRTALTPLRSGASSISGVWQGPRSRLPKRCSQTSCHG